MFPNQMDEVLPKLKFPEQPTSGIPPLGMPPVETITCYNANKCFCQIAVSRSVEAKEDQAYDGFSQIAAIVAPQTLQKMLRTKIPFSQAVAIVSPVHLIWPTPRNTANRYSRPLSLLAVPQSTSPQHLATSKFRAASHVATLIVCGK